MSDERSFTPNPAAGGFLRRALAAAMLLAPAVGAAGTKAPAGATAGTVDAATARLVGGAIAGGGALAIARSLSDDVGARLAGSAGAERAVEWAVAQMRAAGLQHVHKEPVRVPRWERGEAAAEVVAPAATPLGVVALGGSVGTPAGGVTAEVVEVASLEEARALGERARGKIVLFNRPTPRSARGEGYAAGVELRFRGASAAARVGAVAMLVRSVGTGAYRLPHTGGMRYDEDAPRIPAAALTAEDADLLHRRLERGEHVRVRLRMTCRQLPDVASANVVGELPGGERPGEIVLLGAHLDSWDLGTGALDDAAGCAVVLDVAHQVAQLGKAPRRTLRVVLFMNEENGLSGAKAYAAAHAPEIGKHVAALEVDGGAGRPLGFGVVGDAAAAAQLRALTGPLATIEAADVQVVKSAGADLWPLQALGVPVVEIAQDMSTYFDWHHTAGDTFDKIVPVELALDVAAVAVVAHGLAMMPTTLPRLPPAMHAGEPLPPKPRRRAQEQSPVQVQPQARGAR